MLFADNQVKAEPKPPSKGEEEPDSGMVAGIVISVVSIIFILMSLVSYTMYMH